MVRRSLTLQTPPEILEPIHDLDIEQNECVSEEVPSLPDESIVNRLPPEVLSQIFYALQPRSDTYPPYPLPKGFSRWIAGTSAAVCRYWRDVASTTSYLHERIRFKSLDDPTFQLALHAWQTPLSIFYSSPRPATPKTADLLSTPALEAINAQAHRLQELHLSLDAEIDREPLKLLTTLNKTAPDLQALSLIVRSGDWRPLGDMPPLFNSTTPTLRRLTLCRVSYRPITHLRGLTHLYIFHDMMGGFFAHLRHGLAGCPDLEELVIVKCGFNSFHAPHLEPIDVNLPRLRKISLGVVHGLWAAVSLFHHLIIPETAARSVWGFEERRMDDLSVMFNATPDGIRPPRVHTLIVIPRGLVPDGAYFKNGTFYLAGVPSQIRPTFELDNAPVFAQVKRLVIVCEPGNESVHSSAADWSGLLRSIIQLVRSIKNITFASYDPWQFRILVSIPMGIMEYVDGEHTTPVILPHLRSLTLETEGLTSAINNVKVKDRDQDRRIDIQEVASLARYRRRQGRMISEVEIAVDAAAKAQLAPTVGKVSYIKEKWENGLDVRSMVTWLRSMVHECPNSIDSEDDSR